MDGLIDKRLKQLSHKRAPVDEVMKLVDLYRSDYSPQHYLRKLYRDPVTNQQQWGIILAPEDGIMGVQSVI